MRKPRLNELAIILFAGYMAITLAVAPSMFEDAIANNPESLYANYMKILGTQSNMAWISLAIALASFATLFTEQFTVRILMNVAGLVFFTFISASFLFNYPNIGLGAVVLVVVWLFIELWKLIDESEEVKKRKIIVDNSMEENEKQTIDNVEGGEVNGEQSDGGHEVDSGDSNRS